MKKLFIATIMIFSSLCISAQVSGNQVYKHGYHAQNRGGNNGILPVVRPITINDSTLLISAKILLNFEADEYVAVFGVSQEEKSAHDCNTKMNDRIKAFTQKLEGFGILADDIYVDMITQNVIFDYKVEGNSSTQFQKGFELKKNIIFKFKKIEDLDEIIELAAQYNIYDMIKVDYVIQDMDRIYEQLFEAGISKIKKKKRLYLLATDCTLERRCKIKSEAFNLIFPKELYGKYAAYETSEVSTHYRRDWIQIQARKRNTYYYDQLNAKGFDMVINPVMVKVGIQAVMELKIQYKIKK